MIFFINQMQLQHKKGASMAGTFIFPNWASEKCDRLFGKIKNITAREDRKQIFFKYIIVFILLT